jgi:hypothetical protein
MADSNVKTRTGESVRVPSMMNSEEGVLLAAALAATLVEYRHHVGKHSGHGKRKRSEANWRTIGRWEQLQG